MSKLFLQETGSSEFRLWYHQMQKAGADFHSPTLLQFEVGNIVRREFAEDERQAQILEAALDGIDLVTIDFAEPFRHTRTLSYYDATYVCAGEDFQSLATYDAEMVEAARRSSRGVDVWDAIRIRAAGEQGFVAWLRKQHPRDQPLRDFVKEEVLQDEYAQDQWSYLQFWAYLEEYRRPSTTVGTALDMGFDAFVATRTKP